jgi:regulator of sigma E protease
MTMLKMLAALPNHLFTLSTIAVGLIGIGTLIAFHEFGHFLFAKLFNVKTPSFSIGFGPRLISKKIGETDFTLSLFPLGGYVELAGHHEVGQGDQKEADRHDERAFSHKPYWQKLLIMLGGILFNIGFAYIVLAFLFFVGIPKSKYLRPFNMTTTLEVIEKGSPAEKSSLQVGDTITQINGTFIEPNNVHLMLKKIAEHPNETVNMLITRKNTGKSVMKPVTLGSVSRGGQSIGFLGAQPQIIEMPPTGLLNAIKQGVHITNYWIVHTIKSFIYLFKAQDYSNVGGPLLIISQSAKEGSQGWKNLLIFLAIISINLAILNLIPLPILDGGQIFFTTLEAIIGREIPHKVKEYIHIGSWILIVSLILYASYKDIFRMFRLTK